MESQRQQKSFGRRLKFPEPSPHLVKGPSPLLTSILQQNLMQSVSHFAVDAEQIMKGRRPGAERKTLGKEIHGQKKKRAFNCNLVCSLKALVHWYRLDWRRRSIAEKNDHATQGKLAMQPGVVT